MNATSLMYWNGGHLNSQARRLTMVYKINAAKDLEPVVPGYPALLNLDGLTQAEIDDLLESTNEYTEAQFDATSMGADMLAVIIPMGSGEGSLGQSERAVLASARLITGTGPNYDTEALSVALPGALSASTAENGFLQSDKKNLAARFLLTGLDAATEGLVVIDIDWMSK